MSQTIVHQQSDSVNDTSNSSKKFAGIEDPRGNYFMMPHQWLDICAEIDNLAELKVVQYVLRHTWGFQEYDDTPKHITLDEFMHGRKRQDGTRIDKGTGLSRNGVKDGLARAIQDGLLICEEDDSDRGRIEKAYAVNRLQKTEKAPPKHSRRGSRFDPLNTAVEGHDLTPQGHDLTPRGSRFDPRTEKETKERNLEKEREQDSPTVAAHTTDGALSLSLLNDESSSQNGNGTAHPTRKKLAAATPTFASKESAALHTAWIEKYGEYGDTRFDVDALEWMAARGGSFADIEKIYGRLRKEKPDRLVNPELIKKHWGYLSQSEKKVAATSGGNHAASCILSVPPPPVKKGNTHNGTYPTA